MINLGGIDFELKTMNKNPSFYFAEEFIERKMISGKVRRKYKGKRLIVELSYAYLTEQQISDLYGLLNSQQINGSIPAIIDTFNGPFTGDVNISIDEGQKRFKYDQNTNNWIWTNWNVSIIGTDLT